MFRITGHRYLLFTLITLSVVFFYSCNNKSELTFHYSNGSTIKDSVLIHFLNKQLSITVPEYDSTISLNVQTYLDKNIEEKLNGYFREDSLRKVSAMLVVENKTGKVVYCQNSEDLFIYSQRFQNMKMYGMLMSFEKGVKLTDTFSWTGKYSGRKYERTVSRLFRMSPPTLDYKYPFDNYSCSQWTGFLNKLNISTKESDCAGGDWYPRYYFRTSLFDLVKTGALISQNGFVKANNLFGVIKDSNGNRIHSPDLVKGKLLKTESCLLTKKMLKRDPFNVIVFSYPIYLSTEKGVRNGMVLSTKKYTIGFLSASKSENNGFVTEEIYSLASLLED